jgi:endonuclease/exonuclease/phosphatase family metal-dependent hydrolase
MTHAAATLRVLTWNVHGCVGRDGVCDPARVARVLEAAQPDICALQEIDARTRAEALDPFSYFGELFGWTTVSARTLTARDGEYGHIVMSRWPIESLGEVDLSVRFLEPRKAILGAVSALGFRIGIVAAHLGLWPLERRRQFRRLKARIPDIGGGPMIALGDFNDFPGRGLAERNLCPPFEPTTSIATYPSRLPLLPLDRIWYSKPLECVTIATIRDTEHVSDHLPLLASLRLPQAASSEAHARADTSVEGLRPFTTASSHASADA